MDIPYFILLIPYVIIVPAILTLAAFNIWHMRKFGMYDFSGKMNTVVFIGITGVLLVGTVLLLINVPWLTTFTVSDVVNFSFGNNTGIEL